MQLLFFGPSVAEIHEFFKQIIEISYETVVKCYNDKIACKKTYYRHRKTLKLQELLLHILTILKRPKIITTENINA